MAPAARTTSAAAVEREALVQALSEAGPYAPTLCAGWDAHDLAAHLVMRDGHLDLLARRRIPTPGTHFRGEAPAEGVLDFTELLERFAAGAPRWSPARVGVVDDAMNTLEFFVHAEDVLRAGPEEPSPRRDLAPAVEARLWSFASKTLFLAAARSQHRRVTWVSPGFGAVTHGRRRDPLQIVEGAPGELALRAFGRGQVADVAVREV
ncbi:TIGR03085 family metal-binding protein [Nesterenkonia sp. F]|uniref:TIGR03085 family metal-binding protein n=1 Tax=Nesterenkonia sp. F TaxID=795955 RepID=UPI000255C940|nr:TIGR03085 family metal-binding protein [Nesterenkonia sp. F]